jgi:hypothetical protein
MLWYGVRPETKQVFIFNTKQNIKNVSEYINVNTLYQLITLMEGKEHNDYLILLYDNDKPETYVLDSIDKDFYYIKSDFTDLIKLNKLPNIQIISREEYTEKIKKITKIIPKQIPLNE